jgi:MSHA pilin protein MshC
MMHRRTRPNGASLVELVTVMLLLGIIAAIAAPRFFTASDFDSRGYFDSLQAAVRYAQKLAMASDCDVRVRVNASGYALEQWISAGTSCTADVGGIVPVPRPGGGGAFADPPPDNISLGGAGFPALFYFDRIGRPRDANTGASFGNLLLSATDLSIANRTLRIEAETGYTRCIAGC